jgi:hypothetical protein
LHTELGITHLAILHAANDYGREHLKNVMIVAKQYGIQVYLTSYRDNDDELFEASFQSAMRTLEQIPVVYHLGILTGGKIVDPVLKLYDHGLLGPNQPQGHKRVWFFSGTIRDASDIEPGNNPNQERMGDFHRALHGSIAVGDDDSQAELEMLKTMMLQFKQESHTVEYFLSRHLGDSIFAHGNNRDMWDAELDSDKYPIVSNARARSYDGVMALGLAACNAQQDDSLLSTEALHRGLKNVTFQGASGPVAFLETATRDPANMKYR